jgi:hypothetical protein
MHDALADVCQRLLQSDDAAPDSGGTPATVIINIDLEDLQANTGYAVASDGTLLKTDTALAAADQADLYWAITHSTGQVLHLGRTNRIATRAQTIAPPSTPETKDVASPPATHPRNGVNATTFWPGA